MRFLRLALILSTPLVAANAANLVARYDFHNSADLGADVSGNSNNASVSGSVAQGTGPFQGKPAAVFSGGIIQRTTNLTGFNPANGFSLAAWTQVNSSNVAQFNGIISQDSGGCCFNRFLLAPNTLQPYINVGAHVDVSPGSSLSANHWYFVVLTGANESGNGNNAVGHVYVNGQEVSDSPVNFNYALTNPATLNTYLGAGEGGSPYRLRVLSQMSGFIRELSLPVKFLHSTRVRFPGCRSLHRSC